MSAGIFRIVKGQQQAEALLSSSLEKDRLSHAYLFSGPSGVGRLTASLELAASIMCENEDPGYCGACSDCKRILRFGHPDVQITLPLASSTVPEDIGDLLQKRIADGITPVRFQGNTSIRIDQIREIESRLSRKSFENKGHVEIILDADKLREEAANALLKTLEEPPDRTVIVLVSSSWFTILPTVRSRAHLVRFRRLDVDTISEIITTRTEVPAPEVAEYALSADGRPGLALLRTLDGSSGSKDCDPAAVLRGLVDSGSISSVISMTAGLLRKAGRDGSLDLAVSMESFVHDVRRQFMGLEPLSHSVEDVQGHVLSDDMGEALEEVFRKAQARLKGNGRPQIVFTAALLRSWNIINGNDMEEGYSQ